MAEGEESRREIVLLAHVFIKKIDTVAFGIVVHKTLRNSLAKHHLLLIG